MFQHLKTADEVKIIIRIGIFIMLDIYLINTNRIRIIMIYGFFMDYFTSGLTAGAIK